MKITAPGKLASLKPNIGHGGAAFTLIELAARQHEIWDLVRYAIDHDLTPRQREVLTAVAFDDVPMDVVTERFHTNRNAIYKMLHDARAKLKKTLDERGFGVDEILGAFESG